MKIEELVNNLDPVSIIEYKNYLLENLTELCCRKNSNSKIISSHRHEDLFCKSLTQLIHKKAYYLVYLQISRLFSNYLAYLLIISSTISVL